MARARYIKNGMLTRRSARRLLRPYVALLGEVINEAWETWKELGKAAPHVRRELGRLARAICLSDFIKDAILHRFAKVDGCQVVLEYDRPVLVLAQGDLRLQLGKIELDTPPAPRSDRQLSIWRQDAATANTLLAQPSGTWAKCGYVLDETETRLASITVACHLEGRKVWSFDLPVPAPRRAQTATPLVTRDVPHAKISSADASAASRAQQASSD